MEFKPMTKAVAYGVSRMFKDLIGKAFSKLDDGGFLPIYDIAIVPWDEIQKWIFRSSYLESDSVKKALRIYAGPFYDVALLARERSNPKSVALKDIRTYLKEMGMDDELKTVTELIEKGQPASDKL